MYKSKTYEDYYRSLESPIQKEKPEEEQYSFALPSSGTLRIEGDRPDYTVTDFRNDPTTIKNFEIVMDYLSDNSSFLNSLDLAINRSDNDPVEFLRDDQARIFSTINKAVALKDAPENVKRAYQELRQNFDRSEVYGLGEQLNRIKDYGTDILFNYENAAYAGAAILGGAASGGAGAIAALGARAASSKAAAQALKLATKAKPIAKSVGDAAEATSKFLKSPTGLGTYSAGYGGASDLALQNLELEMGVRKDFDPLQTASATVISGLFGYGLGKGISKLGTKRQVEDLDIDPPTTDQPVQLTLDLETGPTTVAVNSIDEVAELSDEEFLRQEMLKILNGTINDIDEVFPDPEEEFRRGMEELLGGLVNDLDNIITEKGSSLQPEDVLGVEGLEELVRRVGGGQETYEAMVDAAIAAAHSGKEQKVIKSDLLFRLHKGLSIFTSSQMFGKAGGFLSPYAEVSPTAKLLQEKTSNEFALEWRLTGGQKTIKEDFAEAQRNITNAFYGEFIKAILPIANNRFNVGLEDEINDALSLALRGQGSSGQKYSKAVNHTAMNIKKVYQFAGELLQREGFISTPIENYVPRQWKRSAIENNKEKFAQLLVESGEAKDLNGAMKIIDGPELNGIGGMLDKNNQLYSGSRDYFFSSNRTFKNITDDAMFEEFLNNDVQQTFFNYMTQAGMALAKKRVFGVRNAQEFERKWINQIRKETKAGGAPLSDRDLKRFRDLYVSLTGEGVESAGQVNQGIQLAQRMALLPLATVSSLTEILLNFGVAGGSTIDGFKAAWNISSAKAKADVDRFLAAHKTGMKTITEGSHKKLIDEFGLTPEEAWHEMQQFGLIMEQQLESMADRLAGDMVEGTMQKVSNKFFRVTMLDQWTKFVQNVSFQTGKRYLAKTIDEVAAHGAAPMTRRMQSKLDDLAEFGIDVEKAKAWSAAGKNRNDPFYTELLQGAARYTNQIILQPTRMSGLKPRAHSTPLGSLAYQLMGYPTAFTNNILKRGAKRFVRDKEMAAEKLVPTALLMTAVAGATNYARTRGEGFEDKDPMQIGYESLARWGGNGILLDQLYRAKNNAEYWKLGGAVSGLFGPTISDAPKLFLMPARTLGTKVPFYGLGKTVLGDETMTEYRETLGDIDKAIGEAITPDKVQKINFAKGGEVSVPQAPEEPDERIDKMTGLPYNEQAGTAFQDEEERSLLARTT